MLFLYTILTYIFYAMVFPYGRLKAAAGSMLWIGRLGLLKQGAPRDLWIHAASVGEVRVVGHLITYLQEKRRDIRIHLTTMTAAGMTTALELYASANVTFSFCPFDIAGPVNRTLDAVNARILVIAETEIWPTLIKQTARRDVPIILVNARLSDSAIGRYRLIRRSMKRVIALYDKFFVKTGRDAERFRSLGATDEQIAVVGDMKFDAPVRARSTESVSAARSKLGVSGSDFVIVAGSTRSGEEEILAEIFAEFSQEYRDAVLVVAPRHVERVNEVRSMFGSREIAHRTLGDESTSGERVILVDKIGLLNELYTAADIAFVGGTLVDIGGHNLLEPVWAGVPVLFGPSTGNVTEAADYILINKFGAGIADGAELLSVLKKVRAGSIMFSVKTDQDTELSATSGAGDYILQKLNHD